MKFLRGAEGKELIPNYNFWVDLPFLIKVMFNIHNGFHISYTGWLLVCG